MKTGEPLEGRLLYPVYVENRIAIPAGTILRGSVIQLDSDRSRRIHARLRGDFTPFHIPVVRFDQLVLPGRRLSTDCERQRQGRRPDPAPVTSARQARALSSAGRLPQEKQRVKDTVALFTAPGRGDRLVQFIYTQLPYHPERIETGNLMDGGIGSASGPEAQNDPRRRERAGDS